MPDFLFIALLVWMFVCGEGGWVSLLAGSDTGWHIRTGEWIIANGRVPDTDLYSFSKAGEPWFAWEWLMDVIYAVLHGAFGLKALVLLSAIILSAFGVILFRHMIWKGAGPFPALLLCLLTIGSSSSHFLARPHIVTLLGFTVCLWLIDDDRRRPGRRIWCVVPLLALWVNLHGGFVGMVASLGLLVVGSLIEQILAAREHGLALDRKPVVRYAALLLCCLAVTMLNPYGSKLHQHVVSYLRSDWIRDNIQEFHAPLFRSESDLQFEVLLFLGLITVPWLLARRQIVPALWILFWGHSALTTVRHVGLFAIVATPYIACLLTQLWDRLVAQAPRGSVREIFRQLAIDMTPACGRNTVWAGVPVLVLLFAPDASVGWPSDFPKQKFPVEMAARHSEKLSSSTLLTQDGWANYLIYRFYPKQRVFFDGRSDFYGARIGTDYIDVTQGHPNWETLLKQYQFNVALCPVKWPLYSLLKMHPKWRLVEEDGLAALFEKAP